MAKLYTFNVSKLSMDEKEQFYKELNRLAFMVDPEETKRGCFIVTWDAPEELTSVVKVPANCTFTVF